ncbi:hypothetical protein PV328_011748 [Microctonus aethiopoides]|uniref:Integrase catalytic domain-containing protein n=1 Tax=Microctonus aethiopoides TaxID=144406 RepID=A0AA39C3I1_9HYME|nr:hypothetical protein PV328_011748 [Microctonus aethiopoides]
MNIEKLRFKFTVLSATDGKSNVICITSIETPDGRVFDIPDESKPSVKEIDEISLILADQYPGINSKELKSFLNEKNIQLVFTAVNSPFSNGLNERLNQTLINKIRCKINEEDKQKKAWSTIAHFCTKRYNKTEHTVTGFAPLYLMNGTDVSTLPNELKNINSEK